MPTLQSSPPLAALDQQLELERMRAIMGRFVVFMAFMMVTYTFAPYIAAEWLQKTVTASAITVPLVVGYAGALYAMMRRSSMPLEYFGVTLRNWRPALREALLWTVPACAAATLVKLGLIWGNSAFADQRLFNLLGVLDPRTSWVDLRASLLLGLVYAAVAPLEEFIVRAGLQAFLRHCLVGPSVTMRAIVISNALFAAGHLHLSLNFAVLAFFPGVLWGTLFARQGNLVGVSVSHLLCGWYVFLVLGFEPWY